MNLGKSIKGNIKLPPKTKDVCDECQYMLSIEKFLKYWKTEIPHYLAISILCMSVQRNKTITSKK